MSLSDNFKAFKIKIHTTSDGSSTIVWHDGQHYHSIHGAVQESLMVFIQNGLKPLLKNEEALSILELGFGTGLNCLLTLAYTTYYKIPTRYTALEAYPIDLKTARQLNYHQYILHPDYYKLVNMMHRDEQITNTLKLTDLFYLRKLKRDFKQLSDLGNFDLIYHDAFGPEYQSSYWEIAFIKQLAEHQHPNGRLVTYCAKGSFKRALRQAGYTVYGFKGPPGKREVTMAIKNRDVL